MTNFYVTLPSNASMQYFPQNTQSSYRTKLISPVILNGEWEVGLAEIFIPRNWFNVGLHNNDYTLTYEAEREHVVENRHYDITFILVPNQNVNDFFLELNQNIENVVNMPNIVKFIPDSEGKNVTIDIANGYELNFSKKRAWNFMRMLSFNDQEKTLRRSQTIKYRTAAILKNPLQTFTIVNKSPIRVAKHIIPLTPIKSEFDTGDQSKGAIFSIVTKNIEALKLQNYVSFKYQPIADELEIKLSDFAELEITEENAMSMLRKLNEENSLVLKDKRTFQVNPFLPIEQGEYMNLTVKEYPKVTKLEKVTTQLYLNVGMYKSAAELFREFKDIRLYQLPNAKVVLELPETYEIAMGKGLAEMLGFVKTNFKGGKHESQYPLELDAGITEILVYSDVIASHHVGDTNVPLLRIIPCMNEKNEQIVKHYEKPIYFPVRKQFIETIEIELRTSAGKKITFMGGKTIACLSFRRKKFTN